MNELDHLKDNRASDRLPVIFIGHGSPMNAISDNPFTQSLERLSKDLPRPQTILCVSAHWMTEGAWITHGTKPRTIHDFFGFPQALFDINYPSPGSPETADQVIQQVKSAHIHPDEDMWGIDHGTWSVLKHMYPDADIPVIQLSLYMSKAPEYHEAISRELIALRERGVLIIGSGNLVHNLHLMDRHDPHAQPFDWAVEFDEWVKDRIIHRNYKNLTQDALATNAGRLSNPSLDHWYPLIYTLNASDDRDPLQFVYEGIDHGSISMRCLRLG